jgi:hypothetical protein
MAFVVIMGAMLVVAIIYAGKLSDLLVVFFAVGK